MHQRAGRQSSPRIVCRSRRGRVVFARRTARCTRWPAQLMPACTAPSASRPARCPPGQARPGRVRVSMTRPDTRLPQSIPATRPADAEGTLPAVDADPCCRPRRRWSAVRTFACDPATFHARVPKLYGDTDFASLRPGSCARKPDCRPSEECDAAWQGIGGPHIVHLGRASTTTA